MKKILALGLIGIAGAILTSRADIIPSYQGTSPSGNNTVVSYTVNVTIEQNATAGDFFTIYDFGNIIPNSNTQPAGWTFSTALTGVNPPQTNSPDDPSILNLTWTYTGPTIVGASPPPPQNIGPFSVTIAGLTPIDTAPQTRTGFFAAQGTRAADGVTKINNVGAIPIPVIPEPSTTALILGSAVLGVLGRAIRRRR